MDMGMQMICIRMIVPDPAMIMVVVVPVRAAVMVSW